jgi:two-component system, NarL family, invasion response regulator UvrY
MEILVRELADSIFGEAKDAQEVIARTQRNDWDLLILDITMPGRSGLDVLSDLRTLRPKLPVLVLTMHSEAQYGKRVLRAGAAGFMNKESAPEELIKAVQKILGGGRYVGPVLAERLASDLTDDVPDDIHEILSQREFEILRMIGVGKTVSQIAGELHLSVSTVSTYRARILEKMKMRTTAELMQYALRNYIVV